MDFVISKVQFRLSTLFFPLFVIDQNRLPTCSNFTQPTPAAAMISFNAFDQFSQPWHHNAIAITTHDLIIIAQ